MVKVSLKGGAVKEYEDGILILDIAKDLSNSLARSACAAKMDGEVCSLITPVTHDCDLEIRI